MADKWLKVLMSEDKKRREKSRGKSDRLAVLMIHTPAPLPGAAPIEELPDRFYTGGGPDGVVQPDRLAMVDMTTNPPSRYHEGEIVEEMGGVKHVTPARDVVRRTQGGPAAMIPTDTTEQARMEQQAQSAGFPGFFAGGTTGVTVWKAPGGQAAFEAANTPATEEQPSSGGGLFSTMRSRLTNQLRPIMQPTMPAAPEPQINVTQPAPAPVLQGQATAAPTIEPQINVTQPVSAPVLQGQATAAPSGQDDAYYDALGNKTDKTVGDVTVTAPPEPDTQTSGDPYAAGIDEGFSALRDRARGEDKVAAMIRERSGDEFDMSAAAQRSRLQQEMLSRGESTDAISSMMSQYDRGDRISRAKMLSDFGIAEAQAAQSAQDALMTQGMNIEQHGATMKREDRAEALTAYNIAMQAGDYDAANRALASAGLPEVDFAKMRAGEYDQVVDSIDKLISGLGTDADPGLLQFLGGVKAKVLSEQWRAFGLDTNLMTLTDAQGNEVNLGDAFNAIDDPEAASPQATAALLNLSNSINTWWENSIGADVLRAQIEVSDEGEALMAAFDDGDEDASRTLGRIIGAAYAQDAGYRLSDTQKKLLAEYELYDESRDPEAPTAETVAPKIEAISQALNTGAADEAKRKYDALTDAEKALTGDFSVLESQADDAFLADIQSRLSTGSLTGMTQAENDRLNRLVKDGKVGSNVLDTSQSLFTKSMLEYKQDARGSKYGYRAWRFNDDMYSYLQTNKGKLVTAPNGKTYQIVDYWEPGRGRENRLKTAYVTLRDMTTGNVFNYSPAGGSSKAEDRPLQ